MKEMIYVDLQKYEETLDCLKNIREDLQKRKRYVNKVDVNNPYINEEVVEKDIEEIEGLISENALQIKMCKGVIRRLNSVLKFDESTEETEDVEETETEYVGTETDFM